MTNPFAGKRIGVLMGGLSAERDVSLNTGKGVHRALLERGHDAVTIDWAEGLDLPAALRAARVDAVWIALHGTLGEDGCVQGLLECMRIPYTGSGVLASALAMDKVLSKRIFDEESVPTPAWKPLADPADADTLAQAFGFPLVVKPSREGSTVGISIVERAEDLAAAVEAARRCHGVTFFEKFIAGRELSIGILDDEVLGTVEIRPRGGTYDYEAKYLRKDTEYLVPAPVSAEVEATASSAALRAYRALGCVGHSRVDVRVDERQDVWVLEVNTLPGMTGTSLLPKIAAHRGINYADLVDRILLSASVRA